MGILFADCTTICGWKVVPERYVVKSEEDGWPVREVRYNECIWREILCICIGSNKKRAHLELPESRVE